MRVLNLQSDEDGATVVEYGLMLGGIALVSIPIVAAIGTVVQAIFLNVSAGI